MTSDGGAHVTLRRATRYLRSLAAHQPLIGPWPDGAQGIARGRFAGNCLAELDRFLHVLMDELAPQLGEVARPAQRNAANKMGRVAGPRRGLAADQVRLRALGRSRACFTRCGGRVRRADTAGGGYMTVGWMAPQAATLQRYALGERLVMTGADLAEVGAFYDRLADDLVAAARDGRGQSRRVPG